MFSKVVLAVCAQALVAQLAYSACLNAGLAAPCGLAGAGLGYAGLAGPYGGIGCGGVASTGGGLPVASASPIPPVGVSVLSENCYEGSLAVGGNLPFLGTVALEGVLPTAGAGAVSYGCGNGAVGIAAEGPIGTGILTGGPFAPAGPAAYGPGIAGYGPGIAGYGPGIAGIAGYGAGIAGYGLGLGNGCGCGCGGLLY